MYEQYRTRLFGRACWLVIGAGLAFSGCKKDSAPLTGECTIEFSQLGGESSNRVDLMLQADSQTYKRVVAEDGGAPTGAIFYRYAGGGGASYRAEELDADNDGELDASMVRSDSLFGLVDLYQVDAVADDDMVDSLQVSVAVPSSAFGMWNPARVYYTLACGPEHDVFASEDNGLITLEVDLNKDGTVDSWMRMFFLDGVLQRWVVDNKLDDVVDFRADLTYDAEGRIAAVEWQDWEFSPVSRSEWAYDEAGLTTFTEDSNGNGVSDHIVHFSPGCWGAGESGPTDDTAESGSGFLSLAPARLGGAR